MPLHLLIHPFVLNQMFPYLPNCLSYHMPFLVTLWPIFASSSNTFALAYAFTNYSTFSAWNCYSVSLFFVAKKICFQFCYFQFFSWVDPFNFDDFDEFDLEPDLELLLDNLSDFNSSSLPLKCVSCAWKCTLFDLFHQILTLDCIDHPLSPF